MLDISKLARLVEENTRSNFGFNNLKSSNSKVSKLYNLYVNQNEWSDNRIAHELGYSSDKDGAFRVLKSSLKESLINGLLFIDPKVFLYPYQIHYNRLYKEWAAVRILLFNGKRGTSIELAKSTLSKSIKYSMTELTFLLAKDIKNHYAQHLEDHKSFNKYNIIYKKYYTYLLKELNLEDEFNQFAIQVKLNNFNKTYWNEKYARIKSDFTQTPTQRHILLSYVLGVNILRQLGEYREILNFSDQIQKVHLDSKQKSPFLSVLIPRHKALAWLKLKNYSKSYSHFDKIINQSRSGTINWYYNYVYFIILHIHQRNYSDASKYFHLCERHNSFKDLIENYKQLFKIIKAHLVFITQRSPQSINDIFPSTFRIGKFLNEVPLYSKDKRRLNISILILHFLFLIRQRRYNEAIDRVDALNQYCYRYLRKDDTFRSNCFIKMLIQVTKADFHPIRAQRYAKKYYDKLLTVPLEIADQPIDVEIVPYEDLWEMVIEVLEDNLKKATR